ncbi:hypothetical protein psyc5s11_39610 [Clostridium gelidum]|uniref:TIGR02678 family protein n=1 Tax=Clostridium gelidum TaxID=704125 RepID=A0ABM7T7B3_9CLOT|nr:TIGR02678 family protein [Clostridium gelidum]BCZ47894.1 hypothetical protein psyc5s11_39610 [Clostridium gelidum]
MENLKKLLVNFYISKEYDRESYYAVKDNIKDFSSFLRDKLGYNVIIRGDFLKLEKIPGIAESFMGIDEFTEAREYSFLMLLLMFLEDKAKEEQFLLSHITEFISLNPIGDSVDWTNYYTRRSLIKVLRFSIKYKIIKINDGNEESFAKDSTKEVLFESTGISKYMVKVFNNNINEKTTVEDILKDENFNTDADKGVLRKYRAYRRLLLSPIVYRNDGPLEDYEYIKTYRNAIEGDFEKYLGLNLQVHKNGALLIPQENKFQNIETFPCNKGISDLTLHIITYINKIIRNEKDKLTNDDLFMMDKEYFEKLLEKVQREKKNGLSKEYRDMQFGKMCYEVINYMTRIKLIEEKEDKIVIYPLCGKIQGDYPRDYEIKDIGSDKNE